MKLTDVFDKKRVHYLCLKSYKHDESSKNTCLWEGEKKYTCYTYRGISLIKYN